MGHRHLAILSAFLLYSVEHNANQNGTMPKPFYSRLFMGRHIEVIDVCQKVLEQGHGPQIGTSPIFSWSHWMDLWRFMDPSRPLYLWILCGFYHYDVVIWKYTGIIHDGFLFLHLWIFYVYKYLCYVFYTNIYGTYVNLMEAYIQQRTRREASKPSRCPAARCTGRDLSWSSS